MRWNRSWKPTMWTCIHGAFIKDIPHVEVWFVRAAGFAQKRPQCVEHIGIHIIRGKKHSYRIVTNQKHFQSSNEHCLTWCGWPRRCVILLSERERKQKHVWNFIFKKDRCYWDWQLEWNRVEIKTFLKKVNFNGGHVLNRTTPHLKKKKCKSRFVLFRKVGGMERTQGSNWSRAI